MSEENNDDKTLEELRQQLAKEQQLREKAEADAAAKQRILGKFDGLDPKAVKEAEELRAKYDGLDDESLEKYKAFQEKLETEEDKKVFEDGGLVALVSRQTSKLQEQHEAQIRQRDQRIEALEKERDNAVRDRRDQSVRIMVDTALSGNEKIVPGMEEFIHFKLQPYMSWTDEGQLKLIDPADGLALVSPADGSKPMTVEEFINTLLPKIAPAVLKPSYGSGGKGSGEGGDLQDNPFMDGTKIKEQAKLRNENLELAKKLAERARAAGKGKQIAVSGV